MLCIASVIKSQLRVINTEDTFENCAFPVYQFFKIFQLHPPLAEKEVEGTILFSIGGHYG